MIVTEEIESMEKQNAYFEQRVPNKFIRVHVIAKDIKARIEKEYNAQMEFLSEKEKQKFKDKFGQL